MRPLVNGGTHDTTPPLQHWADPDEADGVGIGVRIGFMNAGEAAVLGLGRDARGKTVRELSRLWMYLGGGSPKDG